MILTIIRSFVNFREGHWWRKDSKFTEVKNLTKKFTHFNPFLNTKSNTPDMLTVALLFLKFII